MKQAGKSQITYSEKRRHQDYLYFMKHSDMFYQEYGKGYLALRDKKVLGHYKTIIGAYKGLAKNYPPGTYLIQECIADREMYRESIQSFFVFD